MPSRDARAAPLSVVYNDLRVMARQMRRRERNGLTLQTTGLVHEAYLAVAASRLDGDEVSPALYARAMRNVLVSHARRRLADKRGAGAEVLSLDEAFASGDSDYARGERWAQTLLDLDVALEALQSMSPRLHRVVELRFFGGLTVEETAAAMKAGTATVKRDWAKASAWLRCYLHDDA